MLTQTDIKKLKEEFITKKEMKTMLQNVVDELMDFLNPALKKIDNIHEELKGHNDDIDNHERRISKLENKVFAT